MPTPARPVLVVNGKPVRYSAYTVYNDQLNVTRQRSATERCTERYTIVSLSMVQPPLWLSDGVRRHRTQLRVQVVPFVPEPRLPARLTPPPSEAGRIVAMEERRIFLPPPRQLEVFEERAIRAMMEAIRRTTEAIQKAALGLGRIAPVFPNNGIVLHYMSDDTAHEERSLASSYRNPPMLQARSNPSLFGPDPDGVWLFGPHRPQPSPTPRPTPPFPAIIKDAIEWYQTLAYDAERAGDLIRAEAFRVVARKVAAMSKVEFAEWYLRIDHPRSLRAICTFFLAPHLRGAAP